jgi:hypothetical protein
MVVAVVWSEVGVGFFLLLVGLGWAALGRVLAERDEYLRKTAESRWRLFRFLDVQVLTGKRAREEWVERDSRHQRWIYKWVFVPFGLLFAGLALTKLVHGVLS